MAKALGSRATFEVSTDGGSSYTEIGCITNVDFSASVNAVDATCNDTNAGKEYLAGDSDGTATATFHWDPADAGQDILRSNFLSKTSLTWRYRPDVGTGIPQYVFNGFMTELTTPAAHEETLEGSVTVQLSADSSNPTYVESNQT